MSSDEDARMLEPFEVFYDNLAKATHNDYKTKQHSKVKDSTSFEAQRHHLLSLYDNVMVSHSFVDTGGQVFDCVPVKEQPALKRSGRPLASPPVLPRCASEPVPSNIPSLAPLRPGRADRYGNAMTCPEGSVPLRRVTLGEMTKFEDLEHFYKKNPRSNRKRSSQLFTRPDAPSSTEPPHEYAHAYQRVNNIGGHSFLNVWDPTIVDPQVFSLSQQWYVATGSAGLLQTAEVGWQVFPQKYGHSKPVLFTYWTADGYTSSGSYSADAGDFVQYSPTCAIGVALEQVSALGGEQAELELSFLLSEGNWWLYVNGTDVVNAVGYYPTTLYRNGPMTTGATEIDYGGETVGAGSYPAMGSGNFAAQGSGQAAYQRNIYYYPSGGSIQDADLLPSQDWPDSYTIINQQSADWGKYFFFGGPGTVARPTGVTQS
jgi:hypothetical protein